MLWKDSCGLSSGEIFQMFAVNTKYKLFDRIYFGAKFSIWLLAPYEKPDIFIFISISGSDFAFGYYNSNENLKDYKEIFIFYEYWAQYV